jgi:hypothetical protein
MVRAESPPLSSVPPDKYSDSPAGIKYGGLLYHATLESGIVWDSNIFSSKANVVADRIEFVRPGLTISTLDPNYKFTFQTSLEHLDYERAPEEGRTDAQAALRGTVRLQNGFAVDVALRAVRAHEPRSLQRRDLPQDAAEPVLHNDYSASLALRRNLNPVESTLTVSYDTNNYFNVRSNSGTTIDLQNLDREVLTATHNAELRLSHRLSLFSRQAIISSVYRDVPSTDQRDSIKYVLVNGIEVGFTPLIKGRFSFHFAEEHFASSTFEAEPERVYSGELTWSPRRNWRLSAGFARDFGGVNFDLDASGGRRTRATFGLEYDITRQLFFRAAFRYQHANEAGIAAGATRIEDTYQYKASLGYQANRYWNLFFDYAYERRDSRDFLSEFDRQIIQGGAVVRF